MTKEVAIDFLNSVKMAIEEDTLEQRHCEDTISRQAVIDEFKSSALWTSNYIESKINKMPSVTPIRPNGNWIKIHPLQVDDEGAYMCSCCKVGDWSLKGTENFCPNCGADMREVEE